ncbi:MAG TPA: NAD(P)/FAD-dependent oxidoreductase [Nitrosopumilaceae archaeon]|nr:NAD(P)/FAD-dependent oxidoreductase [Nitrosopumilaceae archaeon]
MKIAVCGMGVAGSYLMARLKNDHEVIGFERMPEQKHDSICAWGTIKSTMTELCDKVGVDFSKYVIHDGKKMHVDMNNQDQFQIGLHGLCTYNKLGLIKDFIKDCTVHYGVSPKLVDLEKEFDIIVDCTGFHRVYLPKLERDFFLPTYEYKIQYDDKVPFDDFYIKPFPGMSGYFWYFPLGEKTAHIGAGDYHKQHIVETDKFFKKYGGKVTKTVGRPIRLATPDLCKPFYNGKVVGVGESIGTVYPLLGEGIIPSMMCADIFVKNLGNNEQYEKEVLEYFKIYGKVFKFVRKKIHKDFSILKSLADVLSIFRYMKKNEDRFGMEIHMRDLMKVAKA